MPSTYDHLQNAAATLSAATITGRTMTADEAATIYFQYLDALVAEDNKRNPAAEAGGGNGG